ncbi:hypothetical protein RHMOL_Rhmol01G0289600 [Rhododendron molle]|uniref:Uncharacterized protein n=1 Tax=Rhododendron molle TaxID=49168 RepID=A0ACC0Q9D3_RHOML|nr:hypothetical protein RHMOL_Rhmol01G0289600 [Rhododendron molle]
MFSLPDPTTATATAHAHEQQNQLPPPCRSRRRHPQWDCSPHHQAPKKLLSLAQDDDEGDSCSSRHNKIKPSSSHIHTSSQDRLPPSNVQPLSGTYTSEALFELRKNTKTLVSSSSSHQRLPPSEPVILLKQADELDHDDEREEEVTTAQLAGIGLGKSIPDQATINAIRARRERQSRAAAPDFISLDGGSNHGEAEGLSDEEPEFRERIGFFGDKIEKKGVFDNDDGVGERVVAMEGVGFRKEVDEEEEEEDKIWEEEQFRKGLGKRMDDSSSSGGSVGGTSSNSVALPVVAQSVIPQQKWSVGDGPMESHGRTMASLVRNDENLTTSLLKVTALEKSLSAAGERFIFMQKLRDFVSVLCDFFTPDFSLHKAPFIEELEEQMQKLNEDCAAEILKRRSSDNNDEMLELEAAINAAMSVFNKGGGRAAMIEVATREAKAASAATKEQRNLPFELDGFGRDANLQKRMDMTRRADIQQTRKARSDAKRLSSMGSDGPYQQIERESSTDESDSETAAYESNRDLLLQTAAQVFSDTADEYSQLAVVTERFDSWKQAHPSSYCDAYASLSVPAVFSPYVRLELLKWDPLHKDMDFNDMNCPDDDDDANLVPQLVEKVAILILHHAIVHCWEMLSTREMRNAVSATELVIRYVPASSESLIELVAVLHDRLADAIADLVVPTWSPLVLKAVPNAARVAAYRFGRSVRLMRNICMWNTIIALPILERLVLDDLVSGKVLPHLHSIQSNVHDAVTRTERVIASLGGVWAGPSVAGQRSPKLHPLVDYLLTEERTLQKKLVSGVSEGGTSGLAHRLKKMLVELNEYDHARVISRTFNLKEAL